MKIGPITLGGGDSPKKRGRARGQKNDLQSTALNYLRKHARSDPELQRQVAFQTLGIKEIDPLESATKAVVAERLKNDPEFQKRASEAWLARTAGTADDEREEGGPVSLLDQLSEARELVEVFDELADRRNQRGGSGLEGWQAVAAQALGPGGALCQVLAGMQKPGALGSIRTIDAMPHAVNGVDTPTQPPSLPPAEAQTQPVAFPIDDPAAAADEVFRQILEYKQSQNIFVQRVLETTMYGLLQSDDEAVAQALPAYAQGTPWEAHLHRLADPIWAPIFLRRFRELLAHHFGEELEAAADDGSESPVLNGAALAEPN